MIDHDNWPEDWSKIPEYTEISVDVYEHFLNVLPPLCWYGDYFQCSEPYMHNENGKAMFMTFGKKDGKYVYLGIQYYGKYPSGGNDEKTN